MMGEIMKINRNYFATMIFILIPMLVYGQFWQATGSISGNADAYRIVVDSQDRIFAGVMGVGVFVSADGGTTWTNSGVNGPSIMDLAINNSDHVFAVGNNGVYRTTDNGNTWENVSTGLPSAAVNSIAINNSGRIFVGLYGEKIYRSDDNGSTWERLDSGLSTSTVYVSMAINSSGHIFAGTNGAHVYRSIDNGDNWERLTNGLSEAQVWALEIDSEDRIFAGTGASVFRSTDNGNTWSQQNMGSGSFDINNMTKNSEDHIFATNWHGGVWRSTDHGVSWENLEDPVNGVISWGLGVNLDDYLFCGIGNGQVYRSIESTVAQSGTAPTVITLAETNVTSSGATLNGIVNPNDLSTTVTFEWGETTAYGSQITADQSPLTGTSSTPVSANLTGLSTNTTYHYRVSATNSAGGPINGTDLTFTTSSGGGSSPTVITLAETNVTSSGATLNGIVNPNELSTTVTFEWGETMFYGSQVTADQSPLTGTGSTPVNANLTGLTAGTTYHYRVTATNSAGGPVNGTDVSFTTSTIQELFTRVTTGPVVSDGGDSREISWADIDNDGDQDLFIANRNNENNFLYQNEGNGNFTKITNGEVVTDGAFSRAATWGDIDNDGDPDLFVANTSNQTNLLYRNESSGGNLNFIQIGGQPEPNQPASSNGCSWVDYDNDGGLDLFVTNSILDNLLYHNTGGGSLEGIDVGELTHNGAVTISCAWADYNNDGLVDVFLANSNSELNMLFMNTGGGSFTRITSGSIVDESASSRSANWGDYDNDGYQDLFVSNADANNCLYHNNGDGSFTKITTGDLVNEGNSQGAEWADYDNDGWLDLFVVNYGADNYLYHNNGDGSFTKITGNDILINSGGPLVCSWADYDNDGDLDLILTNAGVDNNVLFSNNGNSKHWINILGVGTTSNASAIGAKVRAKATINGSATWQLREITGQSGYLSQASLNAEFGLGDATIIDSIKVEWPSGIVQVLTNVTVDQFLTITEQTPGSAPTTTTEDATGIGATSATLNGTVNPNDLSTTVLFEYGSTTAYGSQLTADQSPVTGTSAVSVSANLTGLSDNTEYHYRVVATNNVGTTYGADQSFTTILTGEMTPDSNTLLLLHFNNNVIGANDELPTTETGVTYDSGIFGNAAYLSTGTQLLYSSYDNIDEVVGTIEFWIKPLWNGSDNQQHFILSFGYTGGMLIGKDGGNFWRLILNRIQNESGVGIFINSWSAGDWHHCAFAWNSQSLTMYIDGELVNSTNTASSLPSISSATFQLGGDGTTSYLNAVIDELRISDIVRSSNEIRDNYLAGVPGEIPTCVTGESLNITTSSATLNGLINPNGLSTTVSFEYGETTSYGYQDTATQSPVTGSSNVPVSVNLTGLSDTTEYHYRVVATNNIGTTYGADQAFTTLQAGSAPTTTTEVATGIGTNSATLNGTVNPNDLSTTVVFEYGPTTSYGSEIVASESPLTGSSSTSVSADLTGLVENTTYHFRIVATNDIGSSSSADKNFTTLLDYQATMDLDVSFNFPQHDNPADYTTADYRLLGLPGNSGTDIAGYLAGDHATGWQVYWDNGAAANYLVEYDGSANFDFKTGRAFWVISKEQIAINTAVASALLNADNAIEIPLHSGWNMITNPFNRIVSWNAVQATNGISTPLWKFSGSFSESTTLNPFSGYYYSNADGLSELVIPYPVGGSAKQLSTGSADGWQVNIELASGEYRDTSARLGVSDLAKDGIDSYDYRRPRAVGELPVVVFERLHWDTDYPAFVSDIRAQVTDIQFWDFTVTAQERKSAELQMIGVDAIPGNLSVILLDKTHLRTVNLRESDTYTFRPVYGGAEFAVIVGRQEQVDQQLENLLPRQFSLEANFPNPFNPSTTVPINIPEQMRVTVRVYDLLGGQVATLHSGIMEPGRHFLTWRGKDEFGSLMASGIYILRAETEHSAVNRKIILIK